MSDINGFNTMFWLFVFFTQSLTMTLKTINNVLIE